MTWECCGYVYFEEDLSTAPTEVFGIILNCIKDTLGQEFDSVAFDLKTPLETSESDLRVTQESLRDIALAAYHGESSEEDAIRSIETQVNEASRNRGKLRRSESGARKIARVDDAWPIFDWFQSGFYGDVYLCRRINRRLGDGLDNTSIACSVSLTHVSSYRPLSHIAVFTRDQVKMVDYVNRIYSFLGTFMSQCRGLLSFQSGWVHCEKSDCYLYYFGRGSRISNMRDDYAEENMRYVEARAQGISQRFLRGVFDWNLWGKCIVERLGGIKSVKDICADLYTVQSLGNGAVIVELPDQRRGIPDNEEASAREDTRKLLRSRLMDAAVLLPSNAGD